MQATFIPTIKLTQAAKIIGVSRCTVVRWVKSGVLKAEWVGSQIKTTQEWINEVVKPVEVNCSERQESIGHRRKESKSEKPSIAERVARARAISAAIGRS